VTRRALIVVAAALAFASPAAAQGPFGPLNDLAAIGQGEGQLPDRVPTQRNPEPKLEAVPRAKCRAGDHREPGIQGRVPAGTGTKGFNCNVDLLSHQGNSGGFKVLRYIDTKGHECAYYDTSLLFPLSAIRFDFDSPGVAVLDMSDPAKPVQTDTLTEPPMLSPHESLVLNSRRGLIAAVLGNPATAPGTVSVYDASQDCRHPVLQSTGQLARLGHESGFSPDGRTFYATATGAKSITAIDVTDPKAPHPVWQGSVLSHGMSLSPDGNRAYVASATEHELAILDTSEIQARKPNPQVREISRLTWQRASIPQNAIPFTRKGHPYLLEIDEYSAATFGGSPDDVGAARIIDIGDERKPRVIANLRLQVNQPSEHAEAGDDPGAQSPVQGYAAHYCNIPTRVNPPASSTSATSASRA
jgi:DNA-binding beta-propeller fold protein YncE